MKRIHWNEARLVRLSVFFWIGLLCLFGWISGPGLSQAQHPVALITFLGVHVALHGAVLYRSLPLRWQLAYFASQGLLVFGIGLSSPYISLPLGLYAILAGQATAYDLPFRQLIGLMVVYVALMACVFVAVISPDQPVLATIVAGTFFLLMVMAVVTLYRRQIHARAQAEAVAAELKQAHQQLQAYAEQVEDLTLVAERQRIARELHDTLAQGLAGLILQLEATEAHLLNGQTGRAQQIVRHAMTRARTALADARRTIDDLRSDRPTIDDWSAEIHEEIEYFAAATMLPCHLDFDVRSPLPKSIQEHAHRTLTECLTNVARHTRASEVWIRVMQEDTALIVEVRDNGIGFDPNEVGKQPGHYGLRGLQERASITGGTLEITSAPGAGTTVCLHLPLSLEVRA